MHTETFKETLKKNGHKATNERLLLFSLLKSQKGPCSISELVELSRATVDRSTVYRTLDLFEKINVTVRVYSGWNYKVELSDKYSPHHHHMTCENCGAVVAFHESKALILELEKVSITHGFKADSHTLELSGRCKNCCY